MDAPDRHNRRPFVRLSVGVWHLPQLGLKNRSCWHHSPICSSVSFTLNFIRWIRVISRPNNNNAIYCGNSFAFTFLTENMAQTKVKKNTRRGKTILTIKRIADWKFRVKFSRLKRKQRNTTYWKIKWTTNKRSTRFSNMRSKKLRRNCELW